MSKTVFITGATGMLGTLLVEQILETQSDWTTYVLYRTPATLTNIHNVIEKTGLSRGNKIEYVQSAATSLWSGDNDTLVKVNVQGTQNIIDLCLEKNVKKLVVTSSISAYSPPNGAHMVETSPKLGGHHIAFYNQTKFQAEELVLKAVRERGLKACITNPTQILGKYDTGSWVQLFHGIMSKELKFMGSGGGCFANGREVAKAHIAAAEKGRVGENYILGGPAHSFIELAGEVAKLQGEPLAIKVIPDLVIKSLATSMDWYSYYWTGKKPFITPAAADRLTKAYTCDCSKARTELGYNDNIPYEQSVAEEYKWVVEKC